VSINGPEFTVAFAAAMFGGIISWSPSSATGSAGGYSLQRIGKARQLKSAG